MYGKIFTLQLIHPVRNNQKKAIKKKRGLEYRAASSLNAIFLTFV